MRLIGWFVRDLGVMPEDVTPATKLGAAMAVLGFLGIVLVFTALGGPPA